MLNPRAPDYTNTPVDPRRPRYRYVPADSSVTPFVTIITPFYNAAEHFEETASSVLNQSFQQWEWLIVDDGTTEEESLRMLERYELLDRRIRVVRQENRGPSAARNTAFREARTEFVAQIDADDLLEPTAVEKWLWFLLSYPEYGFVKGFSVGFGAERYLWDKGFHTPREFFTANVVQPNCMLRRQVQVDVGGYDEDNREGFEDWDFWMRCARYGHWGGTVPEYLDWYRRRDDHGDRWSNWDGARRQRDFRRGLRQRFSDVWKQGMPEIAMQGQEVFEVVREEIPCQNLLDKFGPRILMILPWMTMGGSDRFSLDLVRQLTKRGWEVSVVTTLHGENLWKHEFERWTPDTFVIENFLAPRDFARFLVYLIKSRDHDVVLISHSQLGYLLVPYLATHCPDTRFVDYNHIDEPEWLNGGYPRFGVGYQDFFDLNITSSRYLRDWMIERGAHPERIEVCYTSIDPEEWQRDEDERESARSELRVEDSTPVILYPARLCDQKRPEVFAETIRRVRSRGHEFLAVVAGDGPRRGWLEGFLRKYGLTRHIKLLGRVEPDEMRRIMSASDILFLPSKWEGIALSVYEAMASSMVVVTADVGGQRELVVPECGFLVARGTEEEEIEEFCEVLCKCLDSPEERMRMGRSAAERIARGFSLEDMAERMIELLARADAERRADDRLRLTPGYARETATLALEYTRLTQLADRLWRNREERLGLHKSWRTAVLRLAYRMALRTPPRVQRQLARVYSRFIARR